MNFKQMPLSIFKLSPTHEVRVNGAIQVMLHKRVGFYAVSEERMNDLLNAEKKLKELKK